MAELGTRQQCRVNVTMFSGHKTVSYCIMTMFVVAIPFRRRDLKTFSYFFMSLKLDYVVALSVQSVSSAQL